MNKTLTSALLAAACLTTYSGIARADDSVSETRTVDSRTVKIKLDGVIDLKIRQGATASLIIYGEKRYVSKVTAVQSGDTLQIDTDTHGLHFGKHQLRAELTLPALREFDSEGVGASEVSGFSGDDIKLILDGAGSMSYTSHYKSVSARLGGVGNLTLNAGDTDSVDLNMRGAGQVVVNGQSKVLRAKLAGVGSLEAQGLHADAIEVDMSGLGSATLHARVSANVKLSGLGSATIYGKPPTRSANARGLGSISWE